MANVRTHTDWIHDRIKESVRIRHLRDAPGVRGRWAKAIDASQAWILVILTGATVAVIAWFIDVVQEWMSDLKEGYCTTNWRYNSKFCCWGLDGSNFFSISFCSPYLLTFVRT